MRKLIIIVAVLALSGGAWAKGSSRSGGHSSGASKGSGGSHSVRGHTTKKGVYVPAHRQTNPDGSKSNNWSHKGNVNPNTGKEGTKQ